MTTRTLPRGICIKGRNTYRRFKITGADGKQLDRYIRLPNIDSPQFAEALDRFNLPVAKRGSLEQWNQGRVLDESALPKGTVVYFLQTLPGYVKIGFTTDLERRVRELQHASPVPVLLLACVLRADRAVELTYHVRFADRRLRGEWFELCPEIEAEIARLNGLRSRGDEIRAPTVEVRP